MTMKYGWTKNVLIHHVEGGSYERFLLGQTNFDQAVPAKYKQQAKLAVRDEYNFSFLEIADEHAEKELETAIMKNMRRFLQEMGATLRLLEISTVCSLERKIIISISCFITGG